MILAVFAPEFILIWALRQRIGAGSIMKEYNRVVLNINKDQKSLILQMKEWFRVQPPPNNAPVWTLTHGFYFQMGGFLLYNKETALRVLHFRDLLELLRLGVVDRPNVTKQDIRDRSKGDFFTGLLVVVQTTWFIAQCAARWAARLPVTELEVITLAFAVLNIITYWLWWEKPQNVCIGVRVQLKEEEINRRGSNRGENSDGGFLSELLFRRSVDETGGQDMGTLFSTEEMDITDFSGRGSSQDANTLVLELCPEEQVTIHFPEKEDSRDASTLVARPSTGKKIPPSLVESFAPLDGFNPQEMFNLPSGWEVNNMFYDRRPRVPVWKRTTIFAGKLLRHLCRGILKSALYRCLREVVLGPTLPATIFRPHTLNVGTFYAYDTLDRSIGLAVFAVASGVLFGGLHLIPWKFTFPTPTKSLLWRISALCITLNPVLLSIPLFLHSFISDRPGVVYRLAGRSWTLKPLQVITMTVPLYILARILIVVLAFVTLRSLPPGAYTEIPWSNFIPHI